MWLAVARDECGKEFGGRDFFAPEPSDDFAFLVASHGAFSWVGRLDGWACGGTRNEVFEDGAHFVGAHVGVVGVGRGGG